MAGNDFESRLSQYIANLDSGMNSDQAAHAVRTGQGNASIGSQQISGNQSLSSSPVDRAEFDHWAASRQRLNKLIFGSGAADRSEYDAIQAEQQSVGRSRNLATVLKQLQDEKAMKTQRWENGVYMGVDSQLAANYDKRIASLKKQIEAANKPQEPKTSEARESLLARLNDINANAGYVSTVEQSDAQDAERRAVLDQLHDEDAALGNNARAYDARERSGEIVRGSTKQIGAGYASFLGTTLGAMGENAEKLDPAVLGAIYTGGDANSMLAIKDLMTPENAESSAKELRGHEQRLNQIADRLSGEASRDLSQAKEGLGALGQFGVDVSSNMIQMGADAIGNAAGLGMLPFFIRAAGSSMQEARLEGADSSKQFLYGLAKGEAEVATEKLFDGVAGIFGKGAADDVVESVIGKLAKSDTGRTVLRAISGAAGEGTEEVISDLLDPFAKLIYNDQALKEAWENRKDLASDMLYDYLVGAAMGAIGGAGSIATGQNAQKNAALRAGEDATAPSVSQQTTQPDTSPTRRSGEDILVDAVNEARSRVESVETGAGIQRDPTQTQNAATGNSQLFNTQESAMADAWQNNIAPQGTDVRSTARIIDGKADQQFAISDAYDRAVSGERSVEIPTEALNRYRDSTGNPIESLITAVKAYYDTSLKGTKVDVQMNGGVLEIKFENDGKKKSVGWRMNSDKAATFERLHQLFENAEYAYSEQNRNVNERGSVPLFHYFVADAVINGEHIPVKLQVRDLVNEAGIESRYYTHNFTQNKNGSHSPGTDNENAANVSVTPTLPNPSIPNSPQNVNIHGEANMRERGFSENIRTDMAMEQEVRAAFEADPSLYRQQSNADTLAKAQEIYSKGTYEAARRVNDAISQAKAGAKLPVEMIPLSRLVANDLARQGKVQEARDMLADIATELTYYGQANQAARILRNSDPMTQATAIERLVDRLNSDLTKGQRRKNQALGRSAEGDIVVNQYLLQQYAQETDSAVKDQLLDEMQQDIADQLPVTFPEKFTALRYLNMLGNLKTQERNIIGNTAMLGVTKVKNLVKAGIEGLASVITNGEYERTTSIRVDSALRKETLADADVMMDELRGEGKYADTNRISNQDIQDKRRIFNSDFLEGYRNLTNWAMDAGDRIFLKATYADALGGWLQAHGIKSIAEATPEQLSQGRAFAIQEAQEATFRDSNAIADWVSSFGRKQGSNTVARVISEGIMPFRKTPANVAIRAVEYSPLGIIETIVKGVQTKSGKANAADVINSASKTVTGSALFAAGIWAAMSGFARGTEDDDELDQFQKQQGAQDYSIKLNVGGEDFYISLSQFAPAAVPFFMGVEFSKALEQEGNFVDKIPTILGAVNGPMLEMSMLGGVNDALSNLSTYGNDASGLSMLLLNSSISYLTQGLTNSMLGQVEQASEEYRQTTYTDPDSKLPKLLQYPLSGVAAKTPGWDYNQQDYIDAWGRRQSNGSAAERILNSFINPTYSSKDRSTEVDAEIERLHNAGKNLDGFPEVIPDKAYRSMEYAKDMRMTPDEYQQYSIDRGQMSLSLVSDFMNSSQYQELSDQQRAEVISNLYSLAADRALKKVKTANGVAYAGNLDDIAALSSPTDYYSYKQVLSDASKDSSTSEDFARVDEMIRRYGLLSNDVQDKLKTTSNLNLDSLLFASTKGIGAEQWYDDREAIKDAADEAGGTDMAKALAVWNNTSGTSEERIAAIEAQLKPDSGGKRNATVRRIEAYDSFCQRNNISNPDLSKWLEIMAAFKDYTTSSSISKANARKAWEEKIGKSYTDSYAGLTWNNARVIFNTYYGDDSYADQYDESYAKLNPAKEKEESDIYGWLTGKSNTSSGQTTTPSGRSNPEYVYKLYLGW